MEFSRDTLPSGPVIVGFSGRGFRVRVGAQDMLAASGLLIDPNRAMEWLDVPAIDALDTASLGDLLVTDFVPEFLLLGTGAHLVQPPRAFVRDMEARGIGVEVMDSRAAARAWGVLRTEERQIIGALMQI
jgi:uncharacterized protein